MSEDLTFNGTRLTWKSNGNKSYGATSGLKQTTIDLDTPNPKIGDARYAKYQDPKKAKFGPVPEGTYTIPILMHGMAHVVNRNMNDLKHCDLAASTGGEETIPEDQPDADGAHPATDPNRRVLGNCQYSYYAWGWHRLRLFKKNVKYSSRDNFYLHDSKKGYSHGCIETLEQFFKDLETYRSKHPNVHSLTLTVKYPSPDTFTYGGTLVPGAMGADPPGR